MKKRIIAIVVILIMASAPSMAQIFLSDEEVSTERIGTTSFDVDLPGQYNSGADWYTPIPGGTLLLIGLGGAYLVSKRKKEKE